MKKLFILQFAILIGTCSLAQSWQDTLASIEKVFAIYQPQNPGCQLAISRNGKLIFSRAWGMADLEHNIQLATTSIIEAGSVSKQFTAAAILLLEQQGKLSLDDDIRKYVPELRDYGSPIKIRHLMHHSSGLRDWGSVATLTGWPRGTKTYSNDDALEIISHQKSLNNKPGDEFIYSNSNFNLQAIIVQRVSGMSLAEFTKRYIFQPAGMAHTQWRDNFNRIVPNRSIAYEKTSDGFEMEMPNEYVYGNGGLLTTAEDLIKWNDYYLNGKFGNPSLLSKQISPEPFNNGLMNNYGAGLFIEKYRGLDLIEHSGSTASYRANLDYFPQLKLSIAWLSNTSQFDTASSSVVRIVRNLFTKNVTTESPKAGKPIIVTEEKLTALSGWYRNDRSGEGSRVSVKDKSLMIDNGGPFSPVKENLFSSGGTELMFTEHGMRYVIIGKDTINYTKVDASSVTPESLKDYPGTYYSEETVSFIVIGVTDNQLIMPVKPGVRFKLSPSYKDAFTVRDIGGQLYFERNKENQVDRFKISIPRARNVEFIRVK